jgi:O-antigen/teichoic acid export membrane protein
LIILLSITLGFSDNDNLTNKIIIILGAVTFLQSFMVIDNYFQSIVKSKLTVITSIIALVISSTFKIVLILIKAPLIYFVYAIVFDSIIITVGMIYLYFKNNQSIKFWNFSKSKAKELLINSWPLILSSIVVSIYMKIDQVMLKEMIDNNAVGQYAAAVRLSEAWYFIPIVICNSLFPAIVSAKEQDESKYNSRLQMLYDLMVWISLGIALPMTFLSDWLVQLLYGSDFFMTGKVLSVHIWAGIFVFLGVSRSKWILTENLQRIASIFLTIGMVTNVVLNLIFIPTIGIYGAALATLASQFVAVILAPLIFKKTRHSSYMLLKAIFFISLFYKIKRK